MKTLIIDCETRGQEDLIEHFTTSIKAPKTWKDQEKIEAYVVGAIKEAKSKMAVDTDYNEIIFIGVKEYGEEGKILGLKEFADYLEELRKENEVVKLVTFNGKSFDLPVIIKNGLKRKLDLPYYELKQISRKYEVRTCKNYVHVDLMDLIGDGNWRSLDTYAQIYLGKSKVEIDFLTCTDEELREHCLLDLQLTEDLFNYFNPII